MKTLRSTLLVSAAAAIAAALSGAPAYAEVDIPCRTAKLVVPWKPGGDTDIIFRLVTDVINESGAKPQLQVVNISGQSGNKGAKEARGAKPDGCTIFAMHESQITTYLGGRVDFTWDAFEPIALLTYTPSVIGANSEVPYGNVEELVAAAKENPGEVKVGVTTGSTSHFLNLLLEEESGAKFKYVPYEGTRERLTAILAHNIDVGEMNILTAKKYLSEGTMKPLGIATEERDPLLPDVATLKEQGYDIVYGLHRGVVAPPETPAPVIEHYEGIFKAAMEDPRVVKAMKEKGTWIVFKDSEAYAEFLKKSYDDHEKVAIKIGMYKK